MTIAKIQNQIAHLESQQVEARSVHERCEGALQLCRTWLGEAMRAEDAAKAEAEKTVQSSEKPVEAEAA